MLLPGGAAAQEEAGPSGVLVVSREQVLSEARVARELADAEARLTAELQAEVDAVKTRLGVEEQELTVLRDQLARDEFDRRVQIFDQEVRAERRRTQARAAALQTAFRRARAGLIDAMIPILVTISRERGAAVVLDRENILLTHPAVDVTNEVVSRLDESAVLPPIPTIADLEPEAAEDLPAARGDGGEGSGDDENASGTGQNGSDDAGGD